MRSLLLVAVALVAFPALADEKVKIAVIPTQLETSAKGAVPSLFDDYLLTSVQNTSNAQVIGQDDIGAMLGFEKQKDLLNCDDTSCMADIGGALGVDKIVSVKIARLGEDWVATAKLINIKTTRVESRVNEIVGGDTKALLQAVPRLIAKLFGVTPPPDAGMQSVPARQQVSTVPQTAQKPPTGSKPAGPNPSFGRGPRIAGTVLLLVGGGLALLGGLWATSIDTCDETVDPYGYTDTSCSLNAVWYTYSTVLIVAGLVVTGVGAKLRANGAVRRDLGDNEVSGRPAGYWLGWLLAAGAMVAPIAGFSGSLDESTAELMGWGCGLGALAVFFIGSVAAPQATSALGAPVQPTIGFARFDGGDTTPTFGFGAQF